MAPATSTRLHVRWMIRRDVPYVLDIEQDQLERECSSWFGFQWTEGDLIKAMRDLHTIGMVVECLDTGKVLGYMVYHIETHSFTLTHIATVPGREEEIFDTLLTKLKSKLHRSRLKDSPFSELQDLAGVEKSKRKEEMPRRTMICSMVPECNLHLLGHLKRNDFWFGHYGKKHSGDVWDTILAVYELEDV